MKNNKTLSVKFNIFIRFNMHFLLLVIVTLPGTLKAQFKDSCNVFFGPANFTIGMDQQDKIMKFIYGFDTVVIKKISLSGFCDDIGSCPANDSLSTKRVKNVKDFLITTHIKDSLITQWHGIGEVDLRPPTYMTDAEQRAFNRRVEIMVNYALKEKPKPIVVDMLSDKTAIGDIITLENILFANNRHRLLAESNAGLDSLTSILLRSKEFKILILGHVCCTTFGKDAVDTDTGKKNLSEARAKTVFDYLIRKGVDPARLAYKGLKGDYPTGKGEKMDRRVEIQITAIKK
ncbi:MAG: OmpA family protein [Bacteroidia bacterium]|nr:OmpA family protein [Bacteroidia bacterium]